VLRAAAGGAASASTLPAAASRPASHCELFSPVPFRHKFHQLVDVGGTDRMNFCADPYRTRACSRLLKAYDALNKNGRIERRLSLPPGSPRSSQATRSRTAERLLDELVDAGGSTRVPVG
jgi:hypothetical protein